MLNQSIDRKVLSSRFEPINACWYMGKKEPYKGGLEFADKTDEIYMRRIKFYSLTTRLVQITEYIH